MESFRSKLVLSILWRELIGLRQSAFVRDTFLIQYDGRRMILREEEQHGGRMFAVTLEELPANDPAAALFAVVKDPKAGG